MTDTVIILVSGLAGVLVGLGVLAVSTVLLNRREDQ